MATVLNNTTHHPGIMVAMATLVIRPEMLIMVATMVGIVDMILLRMRLGVMFKGSSRRRGGCSYKVIGINLLWLGAEESWAMMLA